MLFSMQVVMIKCFLLNPKKTKFGADPSCQFWENAKSTLNFEKWRNWTEG